MEVYLRHEAKSDLWTSDKNYMSCGGTSLVEVSEAIKKKIRGKSDEHIWAKLVDDSFLGVFYILNSYHSWSEEDDNTVYHEGGSLLGAACPSNTYLA